MFSSFKETNTGNNTVMQLERDAGRLIDCRNRLNFCPLGACALAGTGLPIGRFMTSDALGFTAPMRNSIDAVSDRDFVLEFLSAPRDPSSFGHGFYEWNVFHPLEKPQKRLGTFSILQLTLYV
ncbi:hypothetical protein GIB67_037884 [Kingdonia uniflora]|uniref:Fumarate lyase N-terminal domain-containing protein n=1 Tax=Kingdonia uniflora TaxID=39325 RepID=A0A7J7LGY1_9MAGN|nr:hypothetical protein GIB67_037884 [Kingdonia uniflora]